MLRVDDLAGLTVVHVAVRNVSLTGGRPTSSDHLPIARSALEASGLTLPHETVEIRPCEDGYRDWVAHRGGAWTVPIA